MAKDGLIVYVKTDVFTKTLQKILKRDLELQTLKWADHYQKEKIKMQLNS